MLSAYGEIVSTLPSFDTSVGPDKMVFRLIFGTSEKEDTIRKKLERDDVESQKNAEHARGQKQ